MSTEEVKRKKQILRQQGSNHYMRGFDLLQLALVATEIAESVGQLSRSQTVCRSFCQQHLHF